MGWSDMLARVCIGWVGSGLKPNEKRNFGFKNHPVLGFFDLALVLVFSYGFIIFGV